MAKKSKVEKSELMVKLEAAAEEIMEKFDLGDTDLKEFTTEPELKEAIKELESQIPADDENVSEETWATFLELEMENAIQRKQAKDALNKKSKKVVKEETEETEEAPKSKFKKTPKVLPEDEPADEEEAPKTKKAAKTEKVEDEDDAEDAPKASKASKEKPATKKKGPGKAGGVGVIASIVAILKKAPKVGLSAENITEELEALFPDRNAKSMIGTVRVQCGGRLEREKGIKVTVVSKGMYRIA